MQVPKTMYADSNGVSIAYQVIGDGPIDLVFVNGFVSNIETFWSEPLFVRLARSMTRFCRMVVFDKRGTGCSDPVGAAPGFEARMDDIRAVMDAAGIQRAVIDGASEGGPLAMLFAASYPERVQALVLYGTIPTGHDTPDFQIPRPNPVDRLEEFMDFWGEGRTLQLFAPSIADDPLQQRLWGVWERTGASPAMARSLVQAVRDMDVTAVLPTITVPTLVLHQQGDFIPVAGARYIADHIPGAKLVVLPGRDHVPFDDETVDRLVGEVEQFVRGTRTRTESDRQLATVLFTDIVDSTQRATELGDRRWAQLLDEHDRLVRAVLDGHRGREVKTTGDGFLATFDGPARAVRCARELTQQLAAIGIVVRSGVHTGECEIRGEDIGGIAVHLAARVGAMAAPGEVLVTSTVHDLVIGSSLQFTDRARHALKGVPGEWQIYAATGDEEVDLTPLATSTPARGIADRAMDTMAVHTPRLARVGARLSRRMASTTS
jgi:class 3 adenylate cyclase